MQGKEYVSNRQSMKFSYLSILTAMTVMTNDNLFRGIPPPHALPSILY